MSEDVPSTKTMVEPVSSSDVDNAHFQSLLRVDNVNGLTSENIEDSSYVAAETGNANGVSSAAKKKKRRRTKKSGGGGGGTKSSSKASSSDGSSANNIGNGNTNGSVLCISRNKHWKYISSYHGPWLQLPVELLESLLALNLDPTTISNDTRPTSPSSWDVPPPSSTSQQQRRLTGFSRLCDRSSNSLLSLPSSTSSSYSYNYNHCSRPVSPTRASLALPQPSPSLIGKAAPPPVDPGVFRSVINIRRLIDEAAELSVRASSGLSAAALGSLQPLGGGNNGTGGGSGGGVNGINGSSWTAAQALGLGSLNDLSGSGVNNNGGRNTTMSATRVHRLRALAVQKLAEAYKTDEIASSVMVMQRGTVFDDIAEKVLKVDPKNVNARYVHFFHEKIPSRQLAESTSTAILDQLMADSPQRLEFYRTRGIVHCFRDEFVLAAKDFTHTIKESRAVRRARLAHNPAQRSNSANHPKAKRRKNRVNGQAPPDGTASAIEGSSGEQPLIHPSVLPDAPDPIELQALFLRGATYFTHALYLIEETIFKLEGIPRIPLNDFGELQLSNIHGKYGGIEVNNPDGPLGRSDGVKARAYRSAFCEGTSTSTVREQVCALLRKSKRDYEKFLSRFDSVEPSAEMYCMMEPATDPLQKVERGFALLDKFRPINRSHEPLSPEADALTDVPLAFTTYHPFMLESHFNILNCLLLLGEYETLLTTFANTAGIVAGLEGYPVFLAPRSMAQAEFVETLERLAGGWKYGKLPNALVRFRTRDASPPCSQDEPPPTASLTPVLVVTDDDTGIASSSSSAGPSTSTSCSTKTSPASGRRPSLSSDADFDSSPQPIGPQETKVENDPQASLRSSLESLHFLLAPIRTRLHLRAERERIANENSNGAKSVPLGLALHGARVEVFLAWLAAVHLPELESVASTV
ncbi:uncharacterized protein FOMMEDRAFT_170860 [Fomitiporia mediterranea MF3/22]|uniref:uncharacterized protein n=1 Tax=Fomitiporia mediterranea (strain MF3/22) TaxID=694068 RepID=UPI0004409081|nr:uncharacterized protein FOMMEDRAFT_170860 [Fomitiporia mediterranea MF3/22]EJC98607.1 hypothetical protein FOMMEDRAFT_170860 [Fomitiporia mediterranea MF3/22]